MEQYIHSIKEWKPKILDLAGEIQKQMHSAIEEMVAANPSISYQDAANTFILLKIANLEFDLGKLWASQPSIFDQTEREDS